MEGLLPQVRRRSVLTAARHHPPHSPHHLGLPMLDPPRDTPCSYPHLPLPPRPGPRPQRPRRSVSTARREKAKRHCTRLAARGLGNRHFVSAGPARVSYTTLADRVARE